MILFQCGNMAREGLRVLVVSKKSLTEEQYQDFEVRSARTEIAHNPPHVPACRGLSDGCLAGWCMSQP